MQGQYLLYVALSGESDSSAEFTELDEVVEAVAELTRKTFESGRNMITFSVGDMSGTVREDEIDRSNADGQG